MKKSELSLDQIIETLQELGRFSPDNFSGVLPSVGTVHSRLREHPFQQMKEEPLEAVIKGLINLSILTGKSYGSVSVVSVPYTLFVQRYPERDEEITQWILERRINDYDPFGSIVHNDSKSYREFLQVREIKSAIALERMEIDYIAHKAKLERDLLKIKNNLPGAVKRKDTAAVEAMTAKRAKILSEITNS